MLQYSEVSSVANAAIETLRQIGVTACFVGGMACKLYGNNRTPEDLDILCLESPFDVETLKQTLAKTNPSFYLIPSKTPGATFKVLWYRVGSRYSRRQCKVDLLFPGTMDIPSIPTSAISYPEGLSGKPCAPFALVFLSKLHAWEEHLDSDVFRFRLKASTDASDLKMMLPIARRKGLDIRSMEPYLPQSFVAFAVPHAERFAKEFPQTLHEWEALGFSV